MQDYLKDTIDTYNAEALRYQSLREELSPLPEIRKFEALLSGKKLLEVGPGPGRDAHVFVNDGYDVTGIDLSETFIRIASANVPAAKFTLMDLRDLKFEDSTFDGIWCLAVLSHLKSVDIPTALKGFRRVLKPNGIMFIGVREGIGEGTVLEDEFSQKPRYTSLFSQAEFEAYLIEAGFEVLESYLYNERERFGYKYRDINFVFTLSKNPPRPPG